MSDKADLFRENQEKIERIQTMCDNLSEWEADFLISITDWLNTKGSLSVKQQEHLDRIYLEKYERLRYRGRR